MVLHMVLMAASVQWSSRTIGSELRDHQLCTHAWSDVNGQRIAVILPKPPIQPHADSCMYDCKQPFHRIDSAKLLLSQRHIDSSSLLGDFHLQALHP